MTHEERVHYHMYESLEGIAEHAERIVALEDLCHDLWQELVMAGLEANCAGGAYSLPEGLKAEMKRLGVDG